MKMIKIILQQSTKPKLNLNPITVFQSKTNTIKTISKLNFHQITIVKQ
jgi:hypothetical protein